jgi:hypothetical protein
VLEAKGTKSKIEIKKKKKKKKYRAQNVCFDFV